MLCNRLVRSLCTAVVLALSLGCRSAAVPLEAQQGVSTVVRGERYTSEGILAALSRGERLNRWDAPDLITHILHNNGDHPATLVTSLLDGLERLALTPNGSVRQDAVFLIAAGGSVSSKPPIRGTVRRLVRIYRATTDPLVRMAVVSPLGDAAEKAEAIAFLRVLAVQDPDKGDFVEAPYYAIRTMKHIGAPGHAALREMKSSGRLHPRVRSAIEGMEKRGELGSH